MIIKLITSLSTFIGIWMCLFCSTDKITVSIWETLTGVTGKIGLILPLIILLIITIKWLSIKK
jgi:hypothetical protein